MHPFSCKFHITKCKSVTDPLSRGCNGREERWALSGWHKISCINQHTLQLNISLNSWTGKEHASSINIASTPSVFSGNQPEILGWGKYDCPMLKFNKFSHDGVSVTTAILASSLGQNLSQGILGICLPLCPYCIKIYPFLSFNLIG